jgi:hypothetical protein
MQSQGSLSAPKGRLSRFVPLVLGAIAAAHVLGGACCLWVHHLGGQHVPFRATSGVLLILLGGRQTAIALRIRRHQARELRTDLYRGRLFWRWQLVGLVVCYAMSMIAGPRIGGEYIFAVSLASWYTAATLPLFASTILLNRALAWLAWRPLRIVGWSAYFLLLTPLATELSLRVYAWSAGADPCGSYLIAAQKLSPGANVAGRTVNPQGYWDDEFQCATQPGLFRVAAVGDDIMLGGTTQLNFLNQIERRVPGLEVYNFGIPHAGPREYAQQAGEVERYCPDLLLAFVSIGSDITDEPEPPGYFDCRWLHTVQLGSHWFGEAPPSASGDALESSLDQQTYLQQTAARFAICRTPIDDKMRGRWKSAFEHLDLLVSSARKRNIPMAIVVMPGEFQVNPTLCRTLCRRAGYSPEQIDLDLPQRRLADYAKQRGVPMLDLLPHLRASSGPKFRRNSPQLGSAGHAVAAEVLGHWMQSQFGGLIATTAQVNR